MDASYDDIQLQVQVPVRVFSAKSNTIMSVIYFDLFGKPAQITIPAAQQSNTGADYEISRGLLHVLAQNLEAKSNFYMAAKYIPIASQIEELLRDLMLDAMPISPPSPGRQGRYPLDWFLSIGRRRFLLTEARNGRLCATAEDAGPDLPPSTRDVPQPSPGLLSLSTRHLEMEPSRCGKNRVTGSVNMDMGAIPGDARDYTFVCMRELGACAASDGSHGAMAHQIRQLELIASHLQDMSPEDRQVICIPSIRAYFCYEFAGQAGSLPVGALFDELPGLIPLRNSNAPAEVVRDCVLRICKTVEWLMDKGIGWGGSVGCPAAHPGHALLDAIVVDALGRPWLMEGFADVQEGKMLSDRVAVQSLRLDFGLRGAEQVL